MAGLPPPRRPSFAFTLAELLTVMAIVAILAAILVPTLRGVISRADRAHCASNLRQIGVAITLYANDHNNQLPGPCFNSQGSYYGTHDANALPGYLAPYLGLPTSTSVYYIKANVFECPAWRRMVKADTGKIYALQTALNLGNTFTVQPFGYPEFGGYAQKPVVRLAILPMAATSQAMWDFDAQNGGPSDGSVPATPAHGSVRNYLYFDGHVEAVAVPLPTPKT